MKLLDNLGYRLLRRIAPPERFQEGPEVHSPYVGRIKAVVGEAGWEELRGLTVLDFGCACGAGTIEMAQHGVQRVVGLDIRDDCLEIARADAAKLGVAERCTFSRAVAERVDVVVSLDAFEHFDDPAAILVEMHRLLKDGGRVILSFGPTWYHPYGGHLFSVFPWSHVLLTEKAQIRWRSEFKHDGATRIREVAGGMNQLPIKRLVEIIRASPFQIELERYVPIGPLKWAANRLTREVTTSVVQFVLRKPHVADGPLREVVLTPAAQAAGQAAATRAAVSERATSPSRR
jgi:SAM-dependent methyltransferase